MKAVWAIGRLRTDAEREQAVDFAADLGCNMLITNSATPEMVARAHKRDIMRKARSATSRLKRSPTMAMIIREPSKNDARGLAEVHVRSWQAAYKGQVPDDFLDNLSVDQREKQWHLTLNSPSNKVLVAEVDQRIIAFISFGPVRDEGLDKNSIGEVYAIYALEEFWDRGIGRKLMEASLTALRDMNCSIVKIWLLDTNQRAISFYRKFGFSADGAQKVEPLAGVERKEIRYSLSMV